MARRISRIETERSITPPPPPQDSTFQAEPGELEIFCTDFDLLPPPTPPHDDRDSESDEVEDMRTPSTIFECRDGIHLDSPWGPPTKSMTKKKGWVDPPRLQSSRKIGATESHSKRPTDRNELLTVFSRRNRGESISFYKTEPDVLSDDLEKDKPEFAPTRSPTFRNTKEFTPRVTNEIGGNIHVRISYSTPSTLHVTIKKAEDILMKSRTKTCNPYAMVTLLGNYEVFKTQVDRRTQEPIWNETFDFALPLKSLQLTGVLVVVYSNGVNSEGFLGETHISLTDYKHCKVIENWYPLQDMRGEEIKFDGYKELQKVIRSMKDRVPRTLPDTQSQDELRNTETTENYAAAIRNHVVHQCKGINGATERHTA